MKLARAGATAFLVAVLAMLVVAAARAQENEGIFRDAQEGGYFDTKDDEQDWMVFWLCRELDAMKAQRAAEAQALRDDVREVRNILYGVLAAGGGGTGLYAWRKKRNGNGKKNGGKA